MAMKKVEELKVGDTIHTIAARGDISYPSWSKVVKLDPHRTYGASAPNKLAVIMKIHFKPQKGVLKDEEMFIYLDDTMSVTIPQKPGKLKQILNILFT